MKIIRQRDVPSSPVTFFHFLADILTYCDSVTVDHLEYYPLKVARDKKARDDYSRITGNLNKEEVYLIDLIRRDS